MNTTWGGAWEGGRLVRPHRPPQDAGVRVAVVYLRARQRCVRVDAWEGGRGGRTSRPPQDAGRARVGLRLGSLRAR